MAEEFWRFAMILAKGTEIVLIGAEDDFQEVFDRFCNGETFGKIKVSGITDTADRAPMTVGIDLEEVIAVTLVKLYG